MDVLERHSVLRLNSLMIEGYAVKDKPIQYKEYKKKINANYGIFFYNVLKTSNPEMWTIMAKKKDSTYIYSYNSALNEIELKGVRRHACA